jgi:hypothetical protein
MTLIVDECKEPCPEEQSASEPNVSHVYVSSGSEALQARKEVQHTRAATRAPRR